MSKSTRIAFSIFLALAFFLSVFISALRVMALDDFEASTQYFAHGATLYRTVNYLLLAAVLIFFVCGLYLRGKVALAPSDRGIPFYFANAVLGVSLAAYALFSFPVFFRTAEEAFGASPLTDGLRLLCTLFAVAGVFFCIHNCLFPNAERGRRLLFGLSVPLFAVLNVLYLYFDTTTPLNAPNKLFDQFTYVFVALYLLYELRVLFRAPRYAAQCTFGLIAMVFTAVNGFPSFIYMLTHGEPLNVNAAHDALMISLFLYTAIRMLHMLFSESARGDRVFDLLNQAEHPATDFAQRADEIEGEEETEDHSQLTFDSVIPSEIETIPDAALVYDVPIDLDAQMPEKAEESAEKGEEEAHEAQDSVQENENA